MINLDDDMSIIESYPNDSCVIFFAYKSSIANLFSYYYLMGIRCQAAKPVLELSSMSMVGPFPAIKGHEGTEAWFPMCIHCGEIKRMYWNYPSDVKYICKCGRQIDFTIKGYERFIYCRDYICTIEC